MAAAGSTDYSTNINDYKVLTVIGKACHGTASVSVATYVPTNNYVALKIIQLDSLEQSDLELGLIEHEVLMSRKHNHPNLLPIYRTFVNNNQLWIVLPLMGYGSCKDLLHAHFSEGLPEQAIAYIVRDILFALEYLHHRGIIHRSVKASHVTISSEGRTCLSGLRYSMCILERGNRCDNVFDFPDHYIQSLLWAAPEILQQNLSGYNTASDIYSLGITICEIANGVVPFADMPTTQMLLEKIEGTTPRLLDCSTIPELAEQSADSPKLPYQRRFTSAFHNFVELCLQSEPHKRPSASQLLNHSFIKSLKRLTGSSKSLPDLLLPVQPLSDIIGLMSNDEDNSNVDELTENLDNVCLDETSSWSF